MCDAGLEEEKGDVLKTCAEWRNALLLGAQTASEGCAYADVSTHALALLYVYCLLQDEHRGSEEETGDVLRTYVERRSDMRRVFFIAAQPCFALPAAGRVPWV